MTEPTLPEPKRRAWLGANPAMLTGFILMPVVVAAGYVSDRTAPRPALPTVADLRGPIEPPAAPAGLSPTGRSLRYGTSGSPVR